MKILVTGSAGFIGYHLSKRLLERGDTVWGIDNLNDYYDPQLKQDRLSQLTPHDNFHFEKLDISHDDEMSRFFKQNDDFDIIVNLAAQAGVRYSLENPHAYIQSNINGFLNILEGARHSRQLKNLVYASSSSVYGGSPSESFSVEEPVDQPLSLYAATKKSDELMSYCYSHLYKFPSTGLRFFTVYGPWGRPDMAAYLFADAIMKGNPINVFNHGNMMRDFTYIDDIVSGIIAAADNPAQQDDRGVCHRVYNLGNNQSERLMDYIELIESELGKKADKNMMDIQPGDAPRTFANIDITTKELGYKPTTTIKQGIPKFIQWFKEYHGSVSVASAPE